VIKTLLVDTNRSSYPIYQWLIDKGHDVWVVGGNANEPLAKISRNYCQIDYSDVNALETFVDNLEFDFIIPGCTDISYKTCAEINRGRFSGIDTVDATRLINDKSEYRKLSKRLGISVPTVVGFNEALSLDVVIVKPVDSFSGRGISILLKPCRAELEKAFAEACAISTVGDAIIEEFVTGQLYSHSAFISKGQIVADFIVREDCTTNPCTVDTSFVEFDFDDSCLETLRKDVLSLFRELKLVDGLIHTQFIQKDDRYWLIETTRRCPGDLYALLIEMSTGYRYGASYTEPFLGGSNFPHSTDTLHRRIIRHTATSKEGESFCGVSFNKPIDLKLFVPLATFGEFIKPSPDGRAALFFLEASSNEDRDEIYNRLLARNLYSYNYH
jgi:hypothetical protein